jgi:polysaccharide export outer membrane protein
MANRRSFIGFAMAALLIMFTEISTAQVGAQQISPSSMGGSSTTAATSGNRAGAAVPMSGPGLVLVPEDLAKLTLAPGFMVSLNVLDDPDFTGSFRVDQQGDIAVPVLGTVHLAGETVPEARIQIQKRLLDGQILRDPQVNLIILEYAAPEVTVIGEVGSPGRYPLLVPRKLVDVLALAGGTTVTAGNEVLITRGNSKAKPVMVHYSRATDPKAVEDAIVYAGDTVQVKRAGIVYVMGAVTRPGGYVMQEDGTLTVLEAVSLANGTALPASVRNIYLLHRNTDGTEVSFEIPLDKMSHGERGDMPLHATDVLYVPMSKFKAVLLNSQGILAATSSAAIYTVTR